MMTRDDEAKRKEYTADPYRRNQSNYRTVLIIGYDPYIE